MIVFRKKLNAWVVEARDSERQIIIVGNYQTEEEARAADKEYKDKKLAESYALKQKSLEQQAEVMFERYNRYLEFCVLPKSLTQMRENLDSDKNTSANTIRSLMARGYMKSIVLDDKGKHKKYNFVTLKLISFKEALSYASPKKYKPKETDEPTIAGARVINFDDKKLSELYMTQRKTDRANMKSPKNHISGATMSTSDW
jgi:hypothetical protein